MLRSVFGSTLWIIFIKFPKNAKFWSMVYVKTKQVFKSYTPFTSLLIPEHKWLFVTEKRKIQGNSSGAIKGQIILRFVYRKASITAASDSISPRAAVLTCGAWVFCVPCILRHCPLGRRWANDLTVPFWEFHSPRTLVGLGVRIVLCCVVLYFVKCESSQSECSSSTALTGAARGKPFFTVVTWLLSSKFKAATAKSELSDDRQPKKIVYVQKE